MLARARCGVLTYARLRSRPPLPNQTCSIPVSSRYRHATFSLPINPALFVTSFAEAVTSSTNETTLVGPIDMGDCLVIRIVGTQKIGINPQIEIVRKLFRGADNLLEL